MIDETIKNGMLIALQETFATAPMHNLSPKGSKSLKGGLTMSARKSGNGQAIPNSTLSALALGGKI